jgi:hypothetical protein
MGSLETCDQSAFTRTRMEWTGGACRVPIPARLSTHFAASHGQPFSTDIVLATAWQCLRRFREHFAARSIPAITRMERTKAPPARRRASSSKRLCRGMFAA